MWVCHIYGYIFQIPKGDMSISQENSRKDYDFWKKIQKRLVILKTQMTNRKKDESD